MEELEVGSKEQWEAHERFMREISRQIYPETQSIFYKYHRDWFKPGPALSDPLPREIGNDE